MSFLEQNQIDLLQEEMAHIKEKVEKSISAKMKIKNIYWDILRKRCPNNMETTEEIGIVIDNIDSIIEDDHESYNCFLRLKITYMSRITRSR